MNELEQAAGRSDAGLKHAGSLPILRARFCLAVLAAALVLLFVCKR